MLNGIAVFIDNLNFPTVTGFTDCTDFLRKHDAIKDVAVIGLPDTRLGEIAAAIIELKPDHVCTEAEIEDFCKELPRYKRPHKFIFADVPRNPTGKIEKPKLREIYCGESVVAKQIEN